MTQALAQSTTPSRRTLAKGAAWAAPALAVSAAAPALAVSCTDTPWDAYLEYVVTCSSTQCQVVVRICASATCCNNTCKSVPANTAMTITLKNNSTTNDSISKATGSGYTIGTGSTGPGNGVEATLNAGATWTYNITTSSAIPAGSCIQFAWNSVNLGASYTLTATSATDAVPSNSTGCSKTFTTATTASTIALC